MKATAQLCFAGPRKLPRPDKVSGRIAVLDVAFAAEVGSSVSFAKITKPFIDGLGSRLAIWVDHHDHERHQDFLYDPRFVLGTKAQFGGCPEMITPELVHRAGPVDTIVCHVDLDGLYCAAKWLMGGHEPYREADLDARKVDTRQGVPSATAQTIDWAIRARFRDDDLKRSIVSWLVQGRPKGALWQEISEVAAEFGQREANARTLASSFVVNGAVAFCDTKEASGPFDKTELLLLGQKLAEVSVVQESGVVTIAAEFSSGWDFVTLLDLKGGMPTRVSIPEGDWPEALRKIEQAAKKA